MSLPDDAQVKKLAEAENQRRVLLEMAEEEGNHPAKVEMLRHLARSAAAEVKLRRLALAHQEASSQPLPTPPPMNRQSS